MKYVAHGPFIPLVRVGKQYCIGCGLIRLNNDATRRAIKLGCNWNYVPKKKNKGKGKKKA